MSVGWGLFGCLKVRKRAVEYVDGLLSLEEAELVREHLKRCPRCREMVRGMEAAKRAVSLLPTVSAGEGFMKSVMRRAEGAVRRASQRRLRARLLRLLVPVPALVAVLALILLLLLGPSPPPEGGPSPSAVAAAPPVGPTGVHVTYEAAYPLSNLYATDGLVSAKLGER